MIRGSVVAMRCASLYAGTTIDKPIDVRIRVVAAAVLRWYLVVQLLGLMILPLAARAFRRLPDRGYGFSKPLGILLVGVVLWVGNAYGLLRNDSGGAILAVVGVGAAAFVVGSVASRRRRRALLAFLYKIRFHIAAVELLFLLAFGGWALVRAHNPAVAHTEQPMDLLFLSAIWSSPQFPPPDPWLAGYGISYYYFGYWLVATVARLSAQPPEIAYNLGQACWFALLVIGCYTIGWNLQSLSAAASRARARWVGGLATVVA